MLDVNRLRVIDAVARHGSVTAAAKELHYSQPSVTHHLARLESETGAQLIQRVGRGIRLTPAGQLLADRAAEIIGRIDAAGAELSAHVGLTAVYVLSTRREPGLAALRDATWIAGCDRCRSHLLSMCADAGFDPRIGYSSDDMVVMQAWVAAGLGVATQTGLSLRAHHIEGVVATELPGYERHIYAATYGEPPDPPATAALLAALAEAATSATSSAVTSSGQSLPRPAVSRSS